MGAGSIDFIRKYWKWIIAIGGIIVIVAVVVYLWRMSKVKEEFEEEAT